MFGLRSVDCLSSHAGSPTCPVRTMVNRSSGNGSPGVWVGALGGGGDDDGKVKSGEVEEGGVWKEKREGREWEGRR